MEEEDHRLNLQEEKLPVFTPWQLGVTFQKFIADIRYFKIPFPSCPVSVGVLLPMDRCVAAFNRFARCR